MATTISFLRKKSKAKAPLDEDMQLGLDEAKFEMEFLRGEHPQLKARGSRWGSGGVRVIGHGVSSLPWSDRGVCVRVCVCWVDSCSTDVRV